MSTKVFVMYGNSSYDKSAFILDLKAIDEINNITAAQIVTITIGITKSSIPKSSEIADLAVLVQ